PNLTEALLRHGFSETQVRKIMGENWVTLLKDVWGE
ncbi:membrane dipeptidase, partial [Amphritea atlantica]